MIKDHCEVCGLKAWARLSTCCGVHGRTVCDACWEEVIIGGTNEGETINVPEFYDPCWVNWDLIDAPSLEECIAGLKRTQWI